MTRCHVPCRHMQSLLGFLDRNTSVEATDPGHLQCPAATCKAPLGCGLRARAPAACVEAADRRGEHDPRPCVLRPHAALLRYRLGGQSQQCFSLHGWL